MLAILKIQFRWQLHSYPRPEDPEKNYLCQSYERDSDCLHFGVQHTAGRRLFSTMKTTCLLIDRFS